MNRFHITDQAKLDLEGIWLFIASDDIDAADGMITNIIARFSILADSPEMGRSRDELVAGLRSFPVENYAVYYRKLAVGIEIVRILHGARDIPALL